MSTLPATATAAMATPRRCGLGGVTPAESHGRARRRRSPMVGRSSSCRDRSLNCRQRCDAPARGADTARRGRECRRRTPPRRSAAALATASSTIARTTRSGDDVGRPAPSDPPIAAANFTSPNPIAAGAIACMTTSGRATTSAAPSEPVRARQPRLERRPREPADGGGEHPSVRQCPDGLIEHRRYAGGDEGEARHQDGGVEAGGDPDDQRDRRPDGDAPRPGTGDLSVGVGDGRRS